MRAVGNFSTGAVVVVALVVVAVVEVDESKGLSELVGAVVFAGSDEPVVTMFTGGTSIVSVGTIIAA